MNKVFGSTTVWVIPNIFSAINLIREQKCLVGVIEVAESGGYICNIVCQLTEIAQIKALIPMVEETEETYKIPDFARLLCPLGAEVTQKVLTGQGTVILHKTTYIPTHTGQLPEEQDSILRILSRD